MASYMKVHCPICRCEMDGMRGYGRNANCCGRECYQEWEWRNTLAILGKPYRPDRRKRPPTDEQNHDLPQVPDGINRVPEGEVGP